MPLFGKNKKEKDEVGPAEESEQNGGGLSLENLDLSDNNDGESNDEQASELSILDSALGGGIDSLDDESDGLDGGGDADGTKDDEDPLSQDILDIFAGEKEVDVDLAALTHGLEDVDAASLLIQAQQVLALLKRNINSV